VGPSAAVEHAWLVDPSHAEDTGARPWWLALPARGSACGAPAWMALCDRY